MIDIKKPNKEKSRIEIIIEKTDENFNYLRKRNKNKNIIHSGLKRKQKSKKYYI